MLISRHLAIKSGRSTTLKPNFQASYSGKCISSSIKKGHRNRKSKFSDFSTSTNLDKSSKPESAPILNIRDEIHDESVSQIGFEDNDGIDLRVAIVGGGAAGLSTALHLAPLAAAGLISSPIHIYESKTRDQDVDLLEKKASTPKEAGCGPYGRDIGVGIWSSALLSFAKNSSNHKSHYDFLQHIQEKGRWASKVGYRTPDGSWLAKSNLACGPSLLEEVGTQNEDEVQKNKYVNDPALLFLTERELITALRNAVKYEEEECSTILTHYANKDNCRNSTVEGVLAHYDKNGDEVGSSLGLGRLVFNNGSMSNGMYHVIVDASGTVSIYGSSL